MVEKQEKFKMPLSEVVEKLKAVYEVLDILPVKGRNNCAIIAGSMATLEEIITSYTVDEIHEF